MMSSHQILYNTIMMSSHQILYNTIMMSSHQILYNTIMMSSDLYKHTNFDMFCSIWTSLRISHFRLRHWCEIALEKSILTNKINNSIYMLVIWTFYLWSHRMMLSISMKFFDTENYQPVRRQTHYCNYSDFSKIKK